MKRLPLLFLISIILISIPWPVAAMDNTTTVSISNLNIITGSDIEIYGLDVNGTWSLLQVANTSTTGIVFQPGVYSMVFKPSAVARFSNLATLLPDMVSFFETYWVQFIFIAAFLIVVSVAFGGRSGGRRR
jgi:hypothetical protein